MEENGVIINIFLKKGPDTLKVIKAAIPTYTNMWWLFIKNIL